MFLALLAGAQQEAPVSTARELFYAPVPSIPPAGPKAASKKPVSSAVGSEHAKPKWLGLRYRILKRNETGDFVSVRPELAFHAQDRIRIQLESNKAGYLYVVCLGSDSGWNFLFPSPEIPDNRNDVRAFEQMTVPYLQEFIFDQTPGTERVYVVLSERPEEDMDAVLKSVRSNASRSIQSESGLQGLRALHDAMEEAPTGTRDRNLLISRPADEEADSQARNSVYLVNISTEKSRVVAEIRLRHE